MEDADRVLLEIIMQEGQLVGGQRYNHATTATTRDAILEAFQYPSACRE